MAFVRYFIENLCVEDRYNPISQMFSSESISHSQIAKSKYLHFADL